MLRVFANDFINIGGTFALMRHCLYDAEVNNKPFSEENWKELIKSLIMLQEECDKMDLKISSAMVLKKLDNLPIGNSELDMLLDIVKEESKSKLFLLISSDRAAYYDPDKPCWDGEIIDNFSDMVEDIIESNNCFALDRHTACVFHLMRIMEKGVQKFGNKLGVSESFTCNEEWQKILNAIRGQLNILHPKQKDPDRIKYESMLGHLETVKIAWRNPTMHPKATYTEAEARFLLAAVEIFIKGLLKIL
jgi:hypothetical protein